MSARGNTRRRRRSVPAGFRTVVEGDGKRRFRFAGRGVKGAPSRASDDALAARLAFGECQAAHELFTRLAHRDDMTRVESVEAHRAGLAKLALAHRLLGEVLARPEPNSHTYRARRRDP